MPTPSLSVSLSLSLSVCLSVGVRAYQRRSCPDKQSMANARHVQAWIGQLHEIVEALQMGHPVAQRHGVDELQAEHIVVSVLLQSVVHGQSSSQRRTSAKSRHMTAAASSSGNRFP
jgi:hypothetical protein